MLDDQQPPVVVTANAKTVSLMGGPSFPFPGGAHNGAPGPESILPVDFNYDFKTDLVLAGAGGVRFMRQDSPQKFTDVTRADEIATAILNASYTGAWAVDIEADGDLDVVLGTQSGARDSSCATTAMELLRRSIPSPSVSGVQQFVWADLDGDGNPDASLIDGSGQLHIFHNDRAGNFHEMDSVPKLGASWPSPPPIRVTAALSICWPSRPTAPSCVSSTTAARGLQPKLHTSRMRLNPQQAGAPAHAGSRQQWRRRSGSGQCRAEQRRSIWLGRDDGELHSPRSAPQLPHDFRCRGPRSARGHLDLLALDANGQPVKDVNHGTKNYHWQVIRTRAVTAVGDQRINSFGVGGEIQARSGLLLQAQAITGPEEHFGLGEWTTTDVARILWPNGAVNAEFQMNADQEVLAAAAPQGILPIPLRLGRT